METDKIIFLMSVLWYFYIYGVPPTAINYFLLVKYYFRVMVELYNKKENQEHQEQLNNNNNNISVQEDKKEQDKPLPKYEDKYLNEIRKLNKDWIFTDEENREKIKLIEEFYDGYIESKKERIEEITDMIIKLETEIVEDTDDVVCAEDFDDEGNELVKETLEERNDCRRVNIKKLQEEYSNLKGEIESKEGLNLLREKSLELADNFIVNRRLDKLNNCYVIEKTPNGNVLMIYDKVKESFKYYSDSNIPYRYLEVVGRKYVKTFNCRPIFIDMEEELKLFEEKWEREQELKKMKEEDENNKVINENTESIKDKDNDKDKNKDKEQKKNVFTKFKSYNKEAGGKISMAAPPKNSIPNKNITETKENEKVLLKEKANRYTYEGKFANFNFIQKVEKKVFNKRLGLSFADFKKNMNMNN